MKFTLSFFEICVHITRFHSTFSPRRHANEPRGEEGNGKEGDSRAKKQRGGPEEAARSMTA